VKSKVIDGEAVRCVLPWQANLGECPVWHPDEKRLYWVDILEKRINRFDPKTAKNEVFELPEIVPCIALRGAGGLVITLKKQFAFYNPGSGELTRLSEVEAHQPQNRFNDGKCDRQGRFWAGTMDAKEWKKPAGHLFRLGADLVPKQMQSDVICSNGTDWSPDSRTMYYTESFRYTVFAYDFDPGTGAISNRRNFITMPEAFGFPDGLTVDAEGFAWCNIVGPGQIHRFDPDGKLERVVQIPAERATSCTFGGDDLKTLFVTSSRETLTPEKLREKPLSGSLFAIELDIKGLPASFFKG
jgi:sugar lactone lactonase YvrE